MVLGQKVWLRSGELFKEATVTEITDYRVEVEPVLAENEKRYAIRFRINGKPGTIFESFNNKQCGWWEEEDRDPPCTEYGPWELVG
jgi:hypothetical protein